MATATPAENGKKLYRVGTLVYTTGGLIALFCWLLGGEFPMMFKDRALSACATQLITKIGVSDLFYSLVVIAFPSFTNIFLCPIIAYISDRHRGRLGRRIPFLMFTTPFVVVGTAGLGFSIMLGEQLHRLTEFLSPGLMSVHLGQVICFSVFWVLLDFGTTLTGTIANALITDVIPQEVMGRFFGITRGLNLGAGIVFNAVVMGMVNQYYLYIFSGVALFYALGLIILCTKVREGDYPPPPPAESGASAMGKIVNPILSYFKQCFSHPYYVLLIVVFAFSRYACGPFNMYAVRYGLSLDVSMTTYGQILAAAYFCSFLLSVPLGWVADKVHPIRATMVALILYGITMAYGWFFVESDIQKFIIVLFLHTLISGCYITVSASIQPRLFPRAIYAQFHSAFSIMSAAITCLCAWGFGELITYFSTYRVVFPGCIVLTTAAVIGYCFVLQKFKKYGGDKAYRAPMPDER